MSVCVCLYMDAYPCTVFLLLSFVFIFVTLFLFFFMLLLLFVGGSDGDGGVVAGSNFTQFFCRTRTQARTMNFC